MFTWVGDNLYTNVTVSFSEYVNGFSWKVKHLNGEIIDIDVDAGEINSAVFFKV